MNISAILIIVAALLLPGILYIYIAIITKRKIKSVLQFFPLERFLSSDKVGTTIAAAGMSMATVMVALLNLAPFMGIALFTTVITYTLGFYLLSINAPRILRLNNDNLVLQSFLGKEYSSISVRNVATFFTIIGYLSIFSMEILVSVTILEPFFGNWILGFAIIYIVFLLVYTTFSGFRGVVETDRWQLIFIFSSLIALVTLVIISFEQTNYDMITLDYFKSFFTSWNAPLAFIIGVTLMNIPAPFSDAGTWQRVCAARTSADAIKGLRRACRLFGVIWSVLIIVGIILSNSPLIKPMWNINSESLLTGILNTLGAGDFAFSWVILFVLITGLFSAMISTADSLLITAAQVGITGFRQHNKLIKDPIDGLRKSRWLVIILGIGSFAIFITFHLIGFNIIQLVFAIYGAQLALFPTTAVALFIRNRYNLYSLRYFALFSIIVGFVTVWTTAIFGHLTSSMDLQFYSPAFGLAASILIIIFGFLFIKLSKTGRFE